MSTFMDDLNVSDGNKSASAQALPTNRLVVQSLLVTSIWLIGLAMSLLMNGE